MTVIDKSGASDAEFQARVAPFDGAPVPPEVVVETVARAIWECHPGAAPWDKLSPRTPTRDEYRRLAAAAIAAMPPSPAEEAVKRVEALAVELEQPPTLATGAWHGLSPRAVARRIRTALTSPAPAPQGEEGQR